MGDCQRLQEIEGKFIVLFIQAEAVMDVVLQAGEDCVGI